MPYHIKKVGSILDPKRTMYYKGENSWTDVRKDRKIYQHKNDAVADVSRGGSVTAE